ncbi:MAG: STAS domain-containing protein [Deltaproteobacteria bacterium]|nr:STAS domain-containing protein [Deltaproteobacteria bacterium]
MDFNNTKMGDYYVVDVAGRLDATTSSEFEQQCDIWMEAEEYQILIDMSAVEYISSAGLRGILTSAKKIKGKAGNIRFCGLQGMVADVFKMSGFAAMFQIFDSKEQAING